MLWAARPTQGVYSVPSVRLRARNTGISKGNSKESPTLCSHVDRGLESGPD